MKLKILAILLALFTLAGAVSVQAAEVQPVEIEPIVERYTGLARYSTTLSFSGGKCNVTLSGTLYSGYTAAYTLVLNEKDANGHWVPVATWSGSGVSTSRSYNGTSGREYYVHTSITVYSGNTVVDTISNFGSVQRMP